MNIHEHQSKELLKKYGIPVPEGFVIFNKSEISKKLTKNLNQTLVIKAQIHAGGRGKAGGIKIVKNLDEAVREANMMLDKILVTPQTGPKGKKVKRLYIEETCDISSEFYLSCLVDRSASKIAFISSAEGGMDIEEVAKKNPKKITTVKISLSNSVNKTDVEKILKPFNLPEKSKKQAENIIQSLYKILIEKDANLIEINPFILN